MKTRRLDGSFVGAMGERFSVEGMVRCDCKVRAGFEPFSHLAMLSIALVLYRFLAGDILGSKLSCDALLHLAFVLDDPELGQQLIASAL